MYYGATLDFLGNVYGLVRNLELHGRVAGSLHVGAARIAVTGEVGGSLWSMSEFLALEDEGRVERDLNSVVSGDAVIIRSARRARDKWDLAAADCHQAGEDQLDDWDATTGDFEGVWS